MHRPVIQVGNPAELSPRIGTLQERDCEVGSPESIDSNASRMAVPLKKRRVSMNPFRFRLSLVVCCAVLLVSSSYTAAGNTLCVNPIGSHGCYAKIQPAVNHASVNDVINVAPGTYKEDVLIDKPQELALVLGSRDQCRLEFQND